MARGRWGLAAKSRFLAGGCLSDQSILVFLTMIRFPEVFLALWKPLFIEFWEFWTIEPAVKTRLGSVLFDADAALRVSSAD